MGGRDTQFLEQHRGKWRVVIAVPSHARARLGSTKLKRQLNTDSLKVANEQKWAVVAELRALINDTKASEPDWRPHAHELRHQRQRATTDEELDAVDTALSVTVDDMLGRSIGVDVDPWTGEESPRYAPERVKDVAEFTQLATGRGTPIRELHGKYLDQLTVKPRTRSDDVRAIGLLERWCKQEEISAYLQSFSAKRSAVAFMDGLQALEPTLSPVTLNKYLHRLSRYWSWLEKREEVSSNVWQGLKLSVPQHKHDELEREFTDAEMRKLLEGNASQALHDLMRIAALTGCRIDPIVCLRVGDCADGVFIFKPQKKEKGQRACPIHSALAEIVAKRTVGRQPDEPFFPEWPGPKDANSKRERSFKASNQFTEYRRSVGVAVELDGRRRSLVNFHSFRRWFITKAEQADQPEHLIAAVVGHKRTGMTLGRYSSGPLIEQARRCVEAVKLPQ